MTVLKFKFLALLILAILSVVAVVFFKSRISPKMNTKISNQNFAIESVSAASIKNPETLVTSPDGKINLTMTVKNSNNIQDLNLKIDGKEVYEESLLPDESVTLPYNTFSPDNKFIFIKISSPVKNPDGAIYKVLKTNGEPMSEDYRALDIGSFFTAKVNGFIITDITGWAANDLLLINTNGSNGVKGPTFWFSLNSKSFTRLSRRFD